MKRQAYGTLFHFLSESLVRSITVTAFREIYGDEEQYYGMFQSDSRRGFYLNVFTIQQLQYYQQHRDEFPRFDDFVPYLMQQYVDNKEMLLKQFK
jgi:hypothetical protein